MSGVRIRHETQRSATYTIVDASRPYTAPFRCRVCGLTHAFKTYHITLDDQGAAIVSHEIVERIKQMGPVTGFEIVNVVERPPALRVGLNGDRSDMPPIVADPYLRDPI